MHGQQNIILCGHCIMKLFRYVFLKRKLLKIPQHIRYCRDCSDLCCEYLTEVPPSTLSSTSHYLKLTATFSLHSFSSTKFKGTFSHFHFTSLFVGIYIIAKCRSGSHWKMLSPLLSLHQHANFEFIVGLSAP
jgi:hypothetical protein